MDMSAFGTAHFDSRGLWMAHSETLEMLRGLETQPGLFVFDRSVAAEFVVAREGGDPFFRPTHVHYKGGLYRVLGHGFLDGEEMTVYADGHGNRWVRPRGMFEGAMADGRPRFALFRLPGCA